MVLKRPERCFDTSSPGDLPVFVGEHWSRPFRVYASQQHRVGHSTVDNAVCHFSQRLAQYGEGQSGRAVLGDVCGSVALTAKKF